MGGGGNKCYWANSVTEMVIGKGAKVSHSYIQVQTLNAAHIKWTAVQQESASTYKLVEASTGGKLSRHNVHVQQVGPDTSTELSTLHLCLNDQTQDLHSRLIFYHPGGYAWQLHKCIVAHSLGQAVFDGNVKVNSASLWGFVVAFMLFNIKGSNLYFWIAVIPITLLLVVGAKLQHIIATLALEKAGITGYFAGTKLRPRDELFWFKKPELLSSLIHFVLFQVLPCCDPMEGCIVDSGPYLFFLFSSFAGQFLCSYSTLPLYALVTQMGTNYKAALIPQRIRETIHGWGKAAGRKRRHGFWLDDSTTVRTDTSTVMSLEEDDCQLTDIPDNPTSTFNEIKLQPPDSINIDVPTPVANETSSRVGTPLL